MTDSKKKRIQKRRKSSVRAVDVAKLAGCSTATVSRVQNAPDQVSPATIKRVQDAIRRLGYMRNSAARTLRSERSGMVGIVIPTLNHAIHASLVESAQQRLSDEGYSLLVATCEYDLDKEAQQASMLIERGMDGLILLGEQHHPRLYRALEATDVPYINTYVFSPDSPHPCIGIDNRQASFDIAEFLYGLGHRRFGIISSPVDQNDRAALRVTGIRDALAGHGISLSADEHIQRPHGIASGREGLRLLRGGERPPTAIICGNDILAFGALIECQAMGLAVPESVSIVGFDNLNFTGYLNPPLTTMEVPASDMGTGAASFILDRLNQKQTPSKIRLEPKLIARRTAGMVPLDR